MTTHIMVDLETWGTVPGSDIRSIGAVEFDPVAGTLGREFYVNVDDPIGIMRNGEFHRGLVIGKKVRRKYLALTRDPATTQWWSEQSEAAQQRLTTDVHDLDFGLEVFATWWHLNAGPEATFWAKGPHFDEAILAACYRAVGIAIPWHYRAPRDCRTICEAAGGVEIPFEGVEHDALDDAKHQARCVIEAYRKLGLADDLPYTAMTCEQDGYRLDSAYDIGFRHSNGDGTRYRCTDAQILELMKRAETYGMGLSADDRATALLAYNNEQVEKRRSAVALLREAAKHIAGVTGARPGSDSADVVDRIEQFISEIHQ